MLRYLHVGFKAPAHLVTPQRVLKIWTELRCRHTLLTSSVDFEGFEEVRFVHVPLRSYRVAEEAAKRAFEFRNGVEVKDILDEYLNGPRTLSDDMLAKLMITTETPSPTSSPKAEQAAEDDEREYNFWLFATHFLGDGMALHTTANEFFELLGGGLEKLQAENKLEWDVETELVVSALIVTCAYDLVNDDVTETPSNVAPASRNGGPHQYPFKLRENGMGCCACGIPTQSRTADRRPDLPAGQTRHA